MIKNIDYIWDHTSHALIHLTDKIQEQLEEGNFDWEIFVES